MTFGKRPPTQDPNLTQKSSPYDLHAKLIKQQMESLHANALAIQSLSQERSKRYFDAKRRSQNYELKDIVYARSPNRSSKLHPKFVGPFEIVGIKDDIIRLRSVNNRKLTTRHAADLRYMSGGTKPAPVMLILLLISMINYCGSEVLLDRVKPLIWLGTKAIVSPGIAEYDINFAYASPCHLFEKNIRKDLKVDQDLSTDEQLKLEAFLSNCNALYLLEWEQEINQLLEAGIPSNSRHESKSQPARTYQEPNNYRVKREINLGIINANNTSPNATSLSFTQGLLNSIVCRNFPERIHISERTQQLLNRLTALTELKRAINNASSSELFIARLAHDKKITRRDLAQDQSQGINILKELNTWDWFRIAGGPLCTNIASEIIDEKLEARIIALQKELKAFLSEPLIEQHVRILSEEKDRCNNKTRIINKRSVLGTVTGDLLTQAVGVMTGNVISNLVTTVIEWINPASNTNRLGRLESAHQDLQRNFEIARQIDRGILDNLLSNIVQETVKRMNSHIKTFPQYTWLSSLIVSRITLSGLDLRRITDEEKRGKFAAEPFARLIGINGFKDIRSEHTQLSSISKVNEFTINFKFATTYESPNTRVFKVFAFDHWDNLDETPRLLKYTGSNYLIYNETSNCIRALSAQPEDFVSEQCIEQQGEDPALNQWETIIQTDDIEKYTNRSMVKKTLAWNYIYVFLDGSISKARNIDAPSTSSV